MNLEEFWKPHKHINDVIGDESSYTAKLLKTICFEEIDKADCFSLDGPTCYTCNGYNGPCFGDPTCKTCHGFLYPNAGPDAQQLVTILRSSDDNDSGNDEPVEAEQTFRQPYYMFTFQKDAIEPILREIQKLTRNQVAEIEEKVQTVAPYETPQESQLNIDVLPTEVLMHIFEYLDEISLWVAGQVNERWMVAVKMLIRSDDWKEFIYARWPLLYVTYDDQDFYNMYTAIIKSSNCLKCIKQMITQEEFDVEDNSWRKHRLRTELRAMRLDPLEGIYALPLDPLCCHWQASIQGPIGSPYEGGLFFLYIQIPHTYPMGPPIVRFLTKILHPNISRHGDIGIDSIHHNWSLALTISKVLISIQSLLTDPYCEVCMEPAVGALYLDNRPCFDEQARLWTWKYAMHGLRTH